MKTIEHLTMPDGSKEPLVDERIEALAEKLFFSAVTHAFAFGAEIDETHVINMTHAAFAAATTHLSERDALLESMREKLREELNKKGSAT